MKSQAASAEDASFMQLALQQAAAAAKAGEVPVGAVVVKDGVVLGTGRNTPIASHDPSAHAEINALRAAARALGNYRLDGCTLYVTLEPCAMCAGAMLHSRISRLVFATAEPKTGCAGSVLNLFAEPRLNHQTAVMTGVMAEQAAAQMQDFFRGRRNLQREQAWPLREDALRTPDRRFEGLDDYPWPAHYISTLAGLAGLRLHYLYVGEASANEVYVYLHPVPGWSYSGRARFGPWLEQGASVLAPDLIGFGKSDKPKREQLHSQEFHARYLAEWLEHLDVQGATLMAPSALAGLAHEVAQRSGPRIQALSLLQTPAMLPQELDTDGAGQCAPFPDAGHRAALRHFQKQARLQAKIAP